MISHLRGNEIGMLRAKKLATHQGNRRFIVWGSLCLLWGVPQFASAAEIRIVPSMNIEETYTDNVLSSTTNEQSDLITTVSPSVSLRATGARNTINVTASLFRDFYRDNSQLEGDRVSLTGTGTSEIINNLLNVNSRISLSEERVSSSGSQTATDRVNGQNRTRVLNYNISPQIRLRLDNLTDFSTSYTFNQVRFFETAQGTDAGIADSTNHSVSANISRRAGRFVFGASASGSIALEGGTRTSEQRSYSANAEYSFSRQFAIVSSVGQDEFDDNNVDNGDSGGVFWSGGLRWTPSSRTNLRLGYEDRYGDGHFTGDLTYSFSQALNVNASYSFDLLTQQQALANRLDNIFFDEETGTFIDITTGLSADPNNNALNLIDTTQRTESFSVGITGSSGRTNYSLGTSFEERELGLSGGSDKSLSVNGSLGRNLALNLSVGINGSYSRSEQAGATSSSNVYRSGANLSYKFGEHISMGASYSFLLNESAAASETKENTVSINLSAAF